MLMSRRSLLLLGLAGWFEQGTAMDEAPPAMASSAGRRTGGGTRTTTGGTASGTGIPTGVFGRMPRELPKTQRMLVEGYYYHRTKVEQLSEGTGRTVAATIKRSSGFASRFLSTSRMLSIA
jgi:hypothetical protein